MLVGRYSPAYITPDETSRLAKAASQPSAITTTETIAPENMPHARDLFMVSPIPVWAVAPTPGV